MAAPDVGIIGEESAAEPLADALEPSPIDRGHRIPRVRRYCSRDDEPADIIHDRCEAPTPRLRRRGRWRGIVYN